jgi:hypothetical protein
MKTKLKRKKYQLGDYVAPTNNLKIPKLASGLPNELAPGPKSLNPKSPTDPTDLLGKATDISTALFSGLADKAMNEADVRDNPAIVMKKAGALNTAGDFLGAAGKGAAAGAPGGPVGMAVGAGVGLLTTGIGKVLGAKQQKKNLMGAQSDWASSNLSSYQNAMSKVSYVKGGIIKGKGTGKSDSIDMSASNGSFIVPSENADKARELGQEYLNWKPDQSAKKTDGTVDIKASNKEVIFSPQEVNILKYHGVNLDYLAPKADVGAEKAGGGGIHINPANRGKETATEKRTGKSATELAHSKNPKTAARGNFARMAKRHFKPLAEGGPVTTTTPIPVPKTNDNGKQTVYRPGTDQQYDKDLTINPGWDRVMSKGSTMDEVNDSVIGTWNNKPLTAGEFQQFPERVKNTWNFGFETERNKMRLGKPNKFQEMNLQPSSKDVYLPSQNLKAAGNKVAYVGNTKYAKGGRIMKKKMTPSKNMMSNLSSGLKGKKKMPTPGDMNIPGFKKGGTVTSAKAAEILHDGTANGKPLTKKQRGFMAVHANRTAKYAKGGPVDPGYVRNGEDMVWVEDRSNPNLVSKAVATYNAPKTGKNLTTGPSTLPVKNTKSTTKWGFPEVAGAVQAAGGAYGLVTSKAAPDIAVSETLQRLSADVRKQASYGLEPSQMNALNNSVERSRRDTNKMITEAGGSGQEVMSKLNTSLGTTIAGKENIAFQDAAEKSRKFSNVINVDTALAGEEFDVKKMKREDWYKTQDVFASLLSTGLENIIGARQFKTEQQTLRDRANQPTFTIKQ